MELKALDILKLTKYKKVHLGLSSKGDKKREGEEQGENGGKEKGKTCSAYVKTHLNLQL